MVLNADKGIRELENVQAPNREWSSGPPVLWRNFSSDCATARPVRISVLKIIYFLCHTFEGIITPRIRMDGKASNVRVSLLADYSHTPIPGSPKCLSTDHFMWLSTNTSSNWTGTGK